MNIAELKRSNRKAEFAAVCRFIDECDYEEVAHLLEEIRCCHDNLFAWNRDTKLLAKIESVSVNGEAIQLNIESYEGESK
jgi:hypothetical protein